METTLRILRKYHACSPSMKILTNHLGKDYDENKPIDFKVILKMCGVKDCFWALRTQPKKIRMLIGADIAESVLCFYEKQYPDNSSIRNYIQGMRDFCSDKITDIELKVLRSDATAATAAAAAAYADAYAYADADAYAATAADADAYDAAYAAAAYAADAVDAAATAATAAYDAAYAAAAYAADAAQWGKNEKILLRYL